MRVEAALGGPSRVLLRGEAGSGKTTLLRWLAVTAARGAFTGELADWNGLTPVFVKLREYSGRALPAPEAMLDSVAGQITGVMPKAWVERQLADGRALLLIDGVDELLDAERRGVREWVRKLLAAYPEVRMVVTSRPAAAGADWLRREKFTALHLDRMTPPDLAAFVRQWHQAVRELGEELPCPVEELPRYEQSLLNSLKDRPHLQSLAGTPLLAAMLCAMHLTRGSQLPRDRMELYRNALHTLVHERDADRNVPSAVDSGLSLGDKVVLLRDLAWRLSDNNRSEISLEQAAVHVGRKLAGMRHLDSLQDGTTVLESLRDRSGILRSPTLGRLDFVHRTFQEYLAAEEAAEEDRIGNLVERAHLDLWRETIIMAAGHTNRPQREELLGGILDRAAAEPRHGRKLRLLAASCQETLPELSEPLAERVDAAVSALLPPRRTTDPAGLAAVGTSLLRKLPRSLGELTEKQAVQTIRTASLIGGPEALGLLTEYSDDERHEVRRALISAWSYFDADAYADAVLSAFPLETHMLSISHSGQLRAASRLPVSRLGITYPFAEFKELERLPPLTELDVEDVRRGADLSPLAAQDTLSILSLMSLGPLKGQGVLERLKGLISLRFVLEDIPVLEGLPLAPTLVALSMFGARPDTDISFVADHPCIHYVYLNADDPCLPAGFQALSTLPELAYLDLANMDLSAVTRFPSHKGVVALAHCVLPEDPATLRTADLEILIR